MTELSNEQILWLEQYNLTKEDFDSNQIDWFRTIIEPTTKQILETDVIGIYIQNDDNLFRIIDGVRNMVGAWAKINEFAILEMPDDLKNRETGRGFWMYQFTNTNNLPSESILEIY